MLHTGALAFGTGQAAPVGSAADPFAAAFRSSGTSMLLTDPWAPDNPIVAVNDAFLALTGYARREVLGRNCRFLQGPGTDRDDVRRVGEAVAAGAHVEVDLLNYRKDGAPFWNRLTVSPVRDEDGVLRHFFASQTDVTEKVETRLELIRTKAALERDVAERTRSLRDALDARTAALQEIDHRVKNSLQVVGSLLLLGARRAGPPARTALEAMAERVAALSAAHRLCHPTGDNIRFDLGECVADLAADLCATLAPGRIDVDLSVEPAALSAAKAGPAALLVGEILTNALKHAYPGGGRGRLRVAVGRTDDAVRVVVEDEGCGLPADGVPEGFGRTLIDMLARQLRATVLIEDARPGTRAAVVIPLDAGEAGRLPRDPGSPP